MIRASRFSLAAVGDGENNWDEVTPVITWFSAVWEQNVINQQAAWLKEYKRRHEPAR